MILYNKYRPQHLHDIQQQYVCQILEKQFNSNTLASVYIFAGSPGVGKTSLARVLASMLLNETTSNFFSTGEHVDYKEINCADNNGIDYVRENIIDKAKYLPNKSNYKIYTLDECHALTVNGQRSLLKLFEEPPKHVKFLLCTTELDKIIPAIRSRAQIFKLKDIPVSVIVDVLQRICDQEKITYNMEGLNIIAEYSDGSLRSAISSLQQLSEMHVSADVVSNFLGKSKISDAVNIISLLIDKNRKDLFFAVKNLQSNGVDLQDVIFNINKILLDVISTKFGGTAVFNESQALAKRMSGAQIMKLSKATKECLQEQKAFVPIEFSVQTKFLQIIDIL